MNAWNDVQGWAEAFNEGRLDAIAQAFQPDAVVDVDGEIWSVEDAMDALSAAEGQVQLLEHVARRNVLAVSFAWHGAKKSRTGTAWIFWGPDERVMRIQLELAK